MDDGLCRPKLKKRGSKPQEAVSLAGRKSELSAISLGESQGQGQAVGEEVMEVTGEGEGGDSSVGATSPGGKEKGAALQSSSASTSIGPAFDAHFHLNRMVSKGKGKLLVDFIYKMEVSPRDRVDLKGGCTVFCDPKCGGFAEDEGTYLVEGSGRDSP